jgi:hypothetical protein
VGGVPGQGEVVEGVKGVKYAPMPPGMYENGNKKTVVSHTFFSKSLKTLFFTQKYLTRYTPGTFLRNTLVLQIFVTYVKHCEVIPVQSFGSHVRPQLPG